MEQSLVLQKLFLRNVAKGPGGDAGGFVDAAGHGSGPFQGFLMARYQATLRRSPSETETAGR